MRKFIITTFCLLLTFISASAKLLTIDSPDSKYRVVFEELKNKSTSALWVYVAENPSSIVHFLSFVQINFKLANGATINAHDLSDNVLSGGNKFFLNLSDNEAFQLTNNDIKEITIVGLLGNTTFKLKPGSANILKQLGIQGSESSSSSKPSSTTPTKPASAATAVNQGDFVDLGLSVKWAQCNIGASTPEKYGTYFTWEEAEAKANSNGWSLPTKAQAQELIDKCTFKTTTRKGIRGCLVTGPNGNSIFIPYAGEISDGRDPNPGKTHCADLWLEEKEVGNKSNRLNFWYVNGGTRCWLNPQDRDVKMTLRPVLK